MLFVIPARGGSKGIPKKNIKNLGEKSLITYSIDIARHFCNDNDICVTTDDDEIINKIKVECNLSVPFIRPAELATDTSSSYDVLIHAINFYIDKGLNYDSIVLLQPTSPFRTIKNVKDALSEFENSNPDMVVSVKVSSANPYYNLFEENKEGYLEKSKPSNYIRRQDCPNVYEYNGAVYVINVNSLFQNKSLQFEKVKKTVMTDEESLDIDTEFDWKIAELLIEKKNES